MFHEKVTWGIDNFYKKIIRFAAPNTAERHLLSFPDWNKKHHGMWRSSVACLHGVQEVAGSNPVIPTLIIRHLQIIL